MISLRRFTQDDVRDLWLWRNEEETRRNSRDTAPVAFETHDQWCARSLTNPDRFILIAEREAAKAGMIRFDRLDARDVFRVSIIVAPGQRGAGMGRAILSAGCDALLALAGPARLEAEIREENIASRRVFESCGFGKDDSRSDAAFGLFTRLIG